MSSKVISQKYGVHQTLRDNLADEHIRVLRIIARMNIGGPAFQIVNLMEKLDKNIFHQLLVTGNCSEDEKDFLIAKNIKLNELRFPNLGQSINPIKDFLVFIKLRKLIYEYKPHIIHTHTFKAGVLGRIAALTVKQELKTIHTFHGHLLHGYYGKFFTYCISVVERLLATQSSALIAVGEKVKDDLLIKKIGNAKKFKVIYPGIEKYKGVVPSRNKEIKKTRFLWLGRFVSIKRPDRIIEIAQILKAENLPIEIVLAGDGPLRNELQKQAMKEQLPLDFLGWVDNPQLLISSCDAVILVSENEGTPISLIQAQILGKPVISTDVGSVCDTLQHGITGYMCTYDSKIFVSLMMLLCDTHLRKSMGENAENFARERFDLSNFINSHSKLYKSI